MNNRANGIRLVRITTAPVSLHLLLTGQLEYFRGKGFSLFVVSSDGPEKNHITSSGIPFFSVPFTRRITPVNDLICLIRLIFILRKIKPDIVHTHTPKAGFIGMIASFVCGVPHRLHTVAGLPWIEFRGVKRKLLVLIEYLTYCCAHRVYPNSKGLLKFISSLFPSLTHKFKIIANGSSNGIPVHYFTPDEEMLLKGNDLRRGLGIDKTTISIGFIGRLVSEKGIAELLEAFKLLLSTHQHVKLILVGNFEPERDKLCEKDVLFIKECRHIYYAGFQQDVRPWIMAMDIFVFPSYREGFPNALLQAACMARPCIASDIIGNNEIVQHEYSGLLVESKNIQALYAAMVRLLKNPEERKLFGLRAREHVICNYAQDFVWQKIYEEYCDLTHERKILQR